jgi:hypothetical protein
VKQALHIFRKDARHFRYEIAIFLFFIVAFTVSAIRRSLSSGYTDWIVSFILPFMLPLVAWYLIARLIHAEALPGDRQFWITRPYRRWCLLGAKALFVFLFLNVPMFIADAVILHANGFSVPHELTALAAEQLLITAALLIPMVALAAVTTGMVQVVVAILVFGALAVIRSLMFLKSGLPSPIDWINTGMEITTLAMVATVVVWWQYSRRRTLFARIFGSAGVAAAVALATLIPYNWAFWIQSRLSNRTDASSIQIAPSSGTAPVVHLGEVFTFRAPIKVSGIPKGMFLRPDALQVILEAPDGSTWKFASLPWSSGPTSWPSISVSPAFYQKIKDRPMRLRGSAFATLFGDQRRTEVPFDTQSLVLPGAGLCAAVKRNLISSVTCRYPFRDPPDTVDIAFGPTSFNPLGARYSYSLFPAEVADIPVATYSSIIYRSFSGSPVVFTARPLAHIRRDFEIEALRLSEFDTPQRLK